jgi:predicted  nucleic acid-binding Zn-ribbon protein
VRQNSTNVHDPFGILQRQYNDQSSTLTQEREVRTREKDEIIRLKDKLWSMQSQRGSELSKSEEALDLKTQEWHQMNGKFTQIKMELEIKEG